MTAIPRRSQSLLSSVAAKRPMDGGESPNELPVRGEVQMERCWATRPHRVAHRIRPTGRPFSEQGNSLARPAAARILQGGPESNSFAAVAPRAVVGLSGVGEDARSGDGELPLHPTDARDYSAKK